MKKNVIIICLVSILLVIAIGGYLYVADMKREMMEMEQERTDYELTSKTQILSIARSYLAKHPNASPEHIAEIEQKIKGLVEDSTDWAAIKSTDNAAERFDLLKKYISYYPSSANIIEAKKMREADSIAARKQRAAIAAKNAQAKWQHNIDNWNKASQGKLYCNGWSTIQVRFQPCDVNGYGKVEIVQPVWGTIKSTYQLKPNGILVHNNGDPVFMRFTNNGCMRYGTDILRPEKDMGKRRKY